MTSPAIRPAARERADTTIDKNKKADNQAGMEEAAMSTIKLINMYASPWAERVRGALTFKGVPYEKQDYRPGVHEETVRKLTGQA